MRITDQYRRNIGTSTFLYPNTMEGRLHECAAVGLKCIEVALNGFEARLPSYVLNIAAEAKKNALDIWSVHLPFGNEWDISEPDPKKKARVLDRLSEVIRIILPLRPSVAVIHGSSALFEDEQRDQRIFECTESLKIIAEKCEEYGIRLALECLTKNHIGHSVEEMLRIVREVPGLGICFDTNHFVNAGEPVEFVKKAGNHIITTHVSDFFGTKHHCLPGKGCINWALLLSELELAGYCGPMMFEVVNKRDDLMVTPEILVRNWRQMLSD